MVGSAPKWFGIAAVTAIPGLITTVAVTNGCSGDEATPTNATPTPDGAPSSSSSSSGTTTSSSSSGDPGDGSVPDISPDAAPPAGCPQDCLPPAPQGWKGPSAVYDGTTAGKPVECLGQYYTQKEVDAHQGTTAGTTTCDCGTGTNAGAKCTSTISQYAVDACSGGAKSGAVVASAKGGCVDRLNSGGSMSVGVPAIDRGSCSYAEAKVSGPVPTFEKEHIACSQPSPAACFGNPGKCIAVPAPIAPYTRLCIHKDGDESCPSQDYPARFVSYKAVVDNRTCSCSGAPTGGACGTSISTYKASGCFSFGVTGTPGGCLSNAVGSVSIAGLAVSGVTCPGGSLAGSGGMVKDSEAVTFCCNK